MRAMAVAVERIRIGLRHVLGGVRQLALSIAHEIEAALHLGRGGAELRRICRQRIGGVGCRVGGDRSRATEVGMGIVNARVDDRDFDTLAADSSSARSQTVGAPM